MSVVRSLQRVQEHLRVRQVYVAGGELAVVVQASVIKAIAAAKVVAADIDEYLGYHHEYFL